MATAKDLSLGELEALYGRKIRALTDERAAIVKRLAECNEKLKVFEEKLHWVQTLMAAPDSGQPVKPAKKARRKRRSPVREATLRVLRARPGEWLTARQVMTSIRKDTHRRVSRQSVNVNLNQLEQAGQLRRRRATPGSGGAQYVYTAV